MLTMEEEIFPSSSDMPLVQDKKNGRHSRRVGIDGAPDCHFPQGTGSEAAETTDTLSLIPCCQGSTATPQRKTTINKASRLILVSPADRNDQTGMRLLGYTRKLLEYILQHKGTDK